MPDRSYREGYRQAVKDFLSTRDQDFNDPGPKKRSPKRKLSAWNKFVKANSKKPRFRYARSNKINLKKMSVAFRKTPAGKKKRR